MRHAESDWVPGAQSDFERTLNKRGLSDVSRMAKWISRQAKIPDLVLSSSAIRARQTTERLRDDLSLDPDHVQFRADLYETTPGAVIELLQGCSPSLGRILLVGHNPTLEDLILILNQEPVIIPRDGKLMATATIAVLAVPEWVEIEPGVATLVSTTRPGQLLG